MIGARWVIHWSEYASDTYLYGSDVVFHHKDDVEFENQLMPPGAIIKQWYSKTNYQAQRIEPSLPIIDGESTYQISINIDTKENENCLVRLVFYDRYEMEAGSITFRDKVAYFKCPLKTYSYRLQLINGGVNSLRFHSIILQEIDNETDEEIETVK